MTQDDTTMTQQQLHQGKKQPLVFPLPPPPLGSAEPTYVSVRSENQMRVGSSESRGQEGGPLAGVASISMRVRSTG